MSGIFISVTVVLVLFPCASMTDCYVRILYITGFMDDESQELLVL